jgi:hypothetical protein
MNLPDWLAERLGGRAREHTNGDLSPAERRYEEEKVRAEQTIRWADIVTREIQERPNPARSLLHARNGGR